MFGKVTQFVLLSAVVTVLTGCKGETAQLQPAPQSEASAQQKDTVPAIEKKQQREPSISGKPGAKVSFIENIIHRLEPGVDGEVVLELTVPYTEGEMSVNVTTSDGLLIVAGASNYTFVLVEGETYPIPLRLLATEPGRYYANLQVNVNSEGRQTFRSLSAIVQVGASIDRSAPSDARKKIDNSDDVISLPAQEVIIQQ